MTMNLKKFLLPLLLLVGFGIFFYNLGKAHLENWDEAWYGEMTKQMINNKDFIILSWDGKYILDKPPMYIWLSSFFSLIFGLSEFSIRLTSAIAGFLIATLVFVYSKKKFGLVPAIWGFFATLANATFVWRARSGNLDIFASLLIFITFFLIISKYKYKYPLLGLVFSFIYLTKASLVAFPFSIFVLYEIIFERKKIKARFSEYIKLLAIFLGLSGLWLGLGYLQAGPDFVNYYVFKSDQGVSKINLSFLSLDYLKYCFYAIRGYFPFLILGIVLMIKKVKTPDFFLILLFSILLPVILSFAERKNDWYLIPAMPFWSLVIAYSIYQILKFRNIKVISWAAVGLAIFITGFNFVKYIKPLYSSDTVYYQYKSAIEIQNKTSVGETIVRLDHLYPTTIYYSNRKVLSSPQDIGVAYPGETSIATSGTNTVFIGRQDLKKAILYKRYRWFVGTKSDVDQFVQDNSAKWDIITVDEERIAHLL